MAAPKDEWGLERGWRRRVLPRLLVGWILFALPSAAIWAFVTSFVPELRIRLGLMLAAMVATLYPLFMAGFLWLFPRFYRALRPAFEREEPD